MKLHKGAATLALAMIAGAIPAMAADWGLARESYRTFGAPAAVPVPAPIPVADYRPTWYFRFDAGLGVVSDPDVSGHIDDLEGVPGDAFGPDSLSLPAWFDTDFDTFLTLGGGVGYSFNNGWRIDATVEKRSKDDVTGEGRTDAQDTYAFNLSGDYELVDGNTNTIADTQTRFLVTDTAKVDGTIWMLNAYYDFLPGRGFTPYIGAGVGFVWNEISRTQSIRSQTCDNEVLVGGCADGTFGAPSATATATTKGDTVSFAAAAMAGLSYDLTDVTTIDIGYRYLFLGSSSASMTIGGAESTLDIGDQHVHQVRAGVRFNVN